MAYSLAHIARIIGARTRRTTVDKRPIKHLLLDSRTPVFLPEALFFALSGPRRDGHDYLEALYQAG